MTSPHLILYIEFELLSNPGEFTIDFTNALVNGIWVSMSEKSKSPTTKIYKIKIMGHLEEDWSDWFERLTFTYESDGTTTLHCPLPDQAALHSILLKIRDLNIKLISVTQSDENLED